MIGTFLTKRKLAVAGIGAAVSLTAIACGTDDSGATKGDENAPTSTPPPASGSLQSGYDAVRQSLQAEGAVFVRLEEADSGIFDNPYVEVLVNGEKVEIYEFASVADALEASLKVSEDGMMISNGDEPAIAIDFQNRPHYYLQGNVIVVYTGADGEVVELLRSRLGSEFAGDSGEVAPVPGPAVDYDTVVADAPIDNVYITTDPDDPSRYIMYVTSGLPSGCAQFDDWNVERIDDETFQLKVTNRVPAPGELIACTEIYGMKTSVAVIGEVGEDLTACEVYRISYMQYGETREQLFQATAPNVRCADPGVDLDYGDPSYVDQAVDEIDPPQPLISEIQALVYRLQGLGLDASWELGESGSDVFGFKSAIIMVNGEQIQVWDFGPTGKALVAANGVSEDGYSIAIGGGASMYNWIAQPHFYLVGNAIVLYLGDDADLIETLDTVAGQKFAGPNSTPIELPDRPIPVEPDGGIGDGGKPLPPPTDPVDPTRPDDGSDPIPFPDIDLDTVHAPVVSVSPVIMTKSLPPQYILSIVSAQSDGCHQDAGYEVTVIGDEVIIDVYNTVPANLAVVSCIALYSETEHNINLGSDFEAGVEYTIIVNGKEQGTFTGV